MPGTCSPFFSSTVSLLHVKRKFRGHISVRNVLISRQDIFGEDGGTLVFLMGCGEKNTKSTCVGFYELNGLQACIFGLLLLQGDMVVKKFAGFVWP